MSHEIYVRRLRVHAPRQNAVALRLRTEQRLRDASLAPAALPSSAIVIIRRLVTPAADQNWSRAVAAQVETIAQHAARPLWEYVPHDAQSVLFLDAVELLTCYTQDVLAGRDRWYWRDLFPLPLSDPVGARLLAGWRAYPSAVPRLLATLDPVWVRRALAQFSAHDISYGVRLLHAQFGLPDSVFAAQHRDDPPSPESAVPSPPWARWLAPDAAATLPPPAVYLWGLSHVLARQPQQARTPEFAAAARRWLEAAPVAPTNRAASEGAQPFDSAAPDTLPTLTRDGVDSAAPAPDDESPVMQSVARDDRPTSEPDAAPDGTPLPEGVVTELGGVWYLVNAVEHLLALLLPSAVVAVNRWELVTALAFELLGTARDDADPLWVLLRDLAQIDADAPLGETLPVPAAFQVAPEWVVEWAVDALDCMLLAENDRLRVWAVDAALWLADVPARSDAWAALRESFAAAGVVLRPVPGTPPAVEALPDRVDAAERVLSPGLAWWAACARPMLDAWLRGRVPDAHATWPERLTASAVIQVTQTHIDVHLPLDAIDRDIRRAGLDVDPGWAPAYGYIIQFHFE